MWNLVVLGVFAAEPALPSPFQLSLPFSPFPPTGSLQLFTSPNISRRYTDMAA